MTNPTISISVDAATALAYSQASVEEQKKIGVAELRDDRRSAVFLESPLHPPILGDFECLVPPELGARGRIHPCFQQRQKIQLLLRLRVRELFA